MTTTSGPPICNSVDIHDGAVRFHLPADQLEGLGDGDDVVDAGRDLQRFDLVAASAAHGGDDGALGAARDMGLVSGFADAFDDVVDFLFGGFVGHVDDHGGSPCEFAAKNKSRDPWIAACG